MYNVLVHIRESYCSTVTVTFAHQERKELMLFEDELAETKRKLQRQHDQDVDALKRQHGRQLQQLRDKQDESDEQLTAQLQSLEHKRAQLQKSAQLLKDEESDLDKRRKQFRRDQERFDHEQDVSGCGGVYGLIRVE